MRKLVAENPCEQIKEGRFSIILRRKFLQYDLAVKRGSNHLAGQADRYGPWCTQDDDLGVQPCPESHRDWALHHMEEL